MQPQILVLSNPPHQAVDHQAAAAILGMAVEDARHKIDFSAPEVLASSDAERAQVVAEALRSAGMKVVTVDGRALVEIPWPSIVSSFDLGPESLTVRLSAGEVEIPYDTSVLGVCCQPPAGFPGEDADGDGQPPGSPLDTEGLAVAEAIQWMDVLDLYFFPQGDHLHRVTFARDFTDFSGLLDLPDTATEYVGATVHAIERCFTRLRLDTRLVDVRPRHRFVMGDDSFDLDLRKRFSFGTLLLRQVLDSISPELKDVTQWELGSRLAYLAALRP